MIVCAALLAAGITTGIGAFASDRGGSLLHAGDIPGAERQFRLAIAVDPFRSSYQDALSAVYYRRYLTERVTGGHRGRIPESFFETLRWEDRAMSQNPREWKYALRLSSLFLELYRMRRTSSDAVLALRFAENALRINPYGVEALWIRSEILSARNQRGDAVKDLEKAVSVEPNFCRGYAKLAELARATDPASLSIWLGKEEECRGRAATVLLVEEKEKWLVERPEDR